MLQVGPKGVSSLKCPSMQAFPGRLYWQSLKKDASPMDCFPVLNKDGKKKSRKDKRSLEHSKNQGHWYGGGESLNAAWPLEKGNIKLSAFVTGDEGRTEWGNLIKKYFLNSRGLSLTIEDHTPLFVSLNDPEDSGLCIQARLEMTLNCTQDKL